MALVAKSSSHGHHSASLGSKAAQEPATELGSHPNGKLTSSSAGTDFRAFLILSWTAVGVVFGDIGTSPLYVYSSIFAELTPDSAPTRADILGVVSLVFWTLTLEVLVKYMGVVMRADDQGQGGTFALYSLLCRHIGIKPHGVRGPAAMSEGLVSAVGSAAAATPRVATPAATPHASRPIATTTSATAASGITADSVSSTMGMGMRAGGSCGSDSDGDSDDGDEAGQAQQWWQRWSADKERVRGAFRRSRNAQVMLWCVSVTATSMLVGDGVLTPSISVLSAVSGLSVAVPTLSQDVIIGVTIVILVFIFAMQRMGTGLVGKLFAPIIALWFLSNAAINAYNISKYGADVFNALNPAHIVTLFAHRGADAWRSLGAVMLCVTGAEALFADLGHFSRGSISVAFGALAYPSLAITYLGQAAYLLENPDNTDTFWKSLPSKLLYPMLVLATLATIVASQALISALFSIVRQAIILGAFPPVRVVHTGGDDLAAATQVYVPLVNFMLLVLCCAVVGGFQSTVALGKAYGLAVMSDMFITTCLVTLVMLTVWGTSLLFVVPYFLLFLVVEGAFWSANIIKVPQGGWFTLAVAFCVSVIMFVWWAGSRRLGERLAAFAAGSQIRVLGRPQPPPLLATAPLSAAHSRLVAAPSASVPAGPSAPPLPARILSRLSGWALSRKTSNRAQPGGDSAAAAAPALGPNPRPVGGTITAASAPLPLLSKASGAAAHGNACAGSAAAVGVGSSARGVFGLSGRSKLQCSKSCGASLTTPASPASKPGGASVLRRRYRPMPEATFPPGTLALVLPPEAEIGAAPPAAARVATAEMDLELGPVSPADEAAAAAAQPLIVPLRTRLAGIGVYYMDEKIGASSDTSGSLPPVLVHFLGNVQAIHEVCVFLSVRRFPLPSVPRRRRLHIYVPHSATPPNFYQVVAQYGYLDIINHGPAFMSELLAAVQRRLAQAARATSHGNRGPRSSERPLPEEPAADTQIVRPNPPADGPFPDDKEGADARAQTAQLQRGGGQSDRYQSRSGQHSTSVAVHLAAAAESGRLGVGSPAAAGTDAPAARTSRGSVGGIAPSEATRGGTGLEERGPQGIAARWSVEDTLAAFLEAQLHGVVYYASRPLIHPDPRADAWPLTRVWHWFLYGVLYGFLVSVTYDDMQRWKVPSESLVELGMHVEI